MMLPTVSLALLVGAIAATPTSLYNRQGQEPCAEVGDVYNGFVSAELALACLRSVPLQPVERLLTQLGGLRTFVEFQSDLDYLRSDEFAARLYPSVDILGGLDTLEERLNGSFYENEYDFQLDISRLFASAYDGHLLYVPDIVGVFGFQRVDFGVPYRLISVSSDGSALPEVYSFRDNAALAGVGGYEPSPITAINGRNVEEFLNMEAALTGIFQDPDANFNRLFHRTYASGMSAPGSFASPSLPFLGAANRTILSFSNGSSQGLDTVAIATIDIEGLANADDLFQRCCSGNPELAPYSTLIEQIEQTSEVDGNELDETRNRIKGRIGPNIARSTAQTAGSPLLRPYTGGHHFIRQADIVEGGGSSNAVISTDDDSLFGYFSDTEPDLAILALPSFVVGYTSGNASIDAAGAQILEEYQTALALFLDAAEDAGKTRLIIDLRGNTGGLGYLPHQVFRLLFPATELPYQGSNFRAQEVFNYAGQAVADFFATPASALLDIIRPALGVFGLDAAQQLDESNSTFNSWSDFYGPVQVPSVNGDFTEISLTNFSDPRQTSPIDLTRPLGSRQQVFDAENIVLLQDGACASACALFTEFLKTSAPGGPVRQIVVGGRPQTGPMQGVGGVKGGQLGPMLELGVILLSAITLPPASQTLAGFREEVGRETIPNFVEALNRSSVEASAVNYRNSIRENDSSVTPLQYVYEAAECRMFYTAEMLDSQDALWQRVYGVAFGGDDSACVEGSTGHPSVGGGTNFGDFDVPQNAASSVGVTISSVGRPRGGGGIANTEQESGNEDGDESSSSRVRASAASLLVALTAYLLM